MSALVIDLLRRAAGFRRAGRPVGACLVVKARGSTPQSAGALMLIDDAAGIYGTIGGGCVEAEVRRRAFEMLSAGQAGVHDFKLDHDYGWDDGLICGGTLTVAVAPFPGADALDEIVAAVEARRSTALSLTVDTDDGPCVYTLDIPPRPRLHIAGAGHVGQALARLAIPLDFDVTLFDDRHDLLERGAPDAATTVAGDIAERLAAAPVDAATFCVIVTRGHRHDAQALAAVVERDAAYVGMIGSRRKVKMIHDELAERGVAEGALSAVHAPIGAEIGAVTVEEIAVSIAAQLVEVRRRSSRPLVDRSPAPSATGETV